jgi:hypothetical protein
MPGSNEESLILYMESVCLFLKCLTSTRLHGIKSVVTVVRNSTMARGGVFIHITCKLSFNFSKHKV